ncbi:MAG TPA: DUF3592 domain-containing protein [Bacteriovoracaceae bacterium]|nr:DUF3592 domain-containing protein [Bacteriovoracaceae bacterium]
MRKPLKRSLFMGYVMMGFAMIPFTWGAKSIVDNYNLIGRSKVISGQVVEIKSETWYDSKDQMNKVTKTPVIQIKHEGNTITRAVSHGRGLASYTEGQSVEVYYSPTDDLISLKNGFGLFGSNLLPLFFGVFFFLGARFLNRKLGEYNTLVEHGLRVEGLILSIISFGTEKGRRDLVFKVQWVHPGTNQTYVNELTTSMHQTEEVPKKGGFITVFVDAKDPTKLTLGMYNLKIDGQMAA